jgi:hypothetical protein
LQLSDVCEPLQVRCFCRQVDPRAYYEDHCAAVCEAVLGGPEK